MCFAVAFTFPVWLQAQNEKNEKEIELLYFNHGDSVSLRWTPTDADAMLEGARQGYTVQRRTKGESEWTSISPVLIPASNESFAILELNNPDAAAVRELLYRNERDSDGLPRTESEAEFEDNLLFAMSLYACDLSVELAQAAALHFVDRKADKQAVYQYRVIFETGRRLQNVREVEVNMQVKSVLPAPEIFDAKFGKSDVAFSWPIDRFVGFYSGYRIERSLDSIRFEPVKERPIVHGYTDDRFEFTANFRDTLLNRTSMHYYRLSGYSPFGMYGPVSKVVKGRGEPDFSDVVLRIDTVIFGTEHAGISWKMDNMLEKRIKGFDVRRTTDFKSGFTTLNNKMLSPSVRNFKDTKPGKSNYYQIIAYGKSEGQVAESDIYFRTRVDTIPPATPAGLKGYIDSTGIARLSWQPNKEDDILGYQVFVSNSGRDGDFINAMRKILPDTAFSDTLPLNTLTNDIYYKVAAFDRNYNPSKLSDAIKLMKPDTLPPVAALFTKVEQLNGKMVIAWDNSSSLDLKRVELYRSINHSDSLEQLQEWIVPQLVSSYTDPFEFKPETPIRYVIRSYDESGNMSEKRSLPYFFKGELPPCIGNLTVEIERTEKKQIQLRWERTSDCKLTRTVIYRKEGENGRMLPVASIGPNNFFYIDPDVSIGSKYIYIVRAIAERSSKAIYSNEITF